MDKWDDLVNRVKQGILAEEPEASLAGALQLFAEFGRTLDLIAGALGNRLKAGSHVEMAGSYPYLFISVPGDDEHVLFTREGEERLINADDLDEFWDFLDQNGSTETSTPVPAEHDL